MKINFTSTRILLTVTIALFLTVAQAQTRKFTGKVISEHDKSTLPGVSIVVKGTNNGTQTDSNGSFSVDVTKGSVLVFSYVGYVPQQVVVSDQQNINIVLKEDATKLNEVLIVGYGEQSRKTVTSAVAKLDNQVLATTPRANVATAFQGTVSGIQVINQSGSPGAAPLLLLRGGASINSPTSPLVVVDGVIRSYQDIAQEDIASVDILKDAAATAIYGARANNGVILITTKQGKAGTGNITYKFTTGFNRQREGYQYLGARDYIYYGRLGRFNNFTALTPETALTAGQLTTLNNSRGYGLLTDPANLATFDIQAESPANINLLQQGWQEMDDPANPGSKIIFRDHSKDIQNMVFRNTQTVDHYISASGGNEKGKYFASFDYYNEPGVIIGSDYTRYSGNFNGSYKVKPNVEVNSGVTFSTSSQLGTIGSATTNYDVNTMYRTLSLWPTFNPWLDAAKTQPNPGNSITDGNPLYWLQHQKNSNEVDRIVANAGVKWDLMPGLTFKLSGSGYLFQTLNQGFQGATQLYSNLFATPPTYSSTLRPATATYNRSFQQTYDATINYNKSFGKHDLSVLVGAEYFDQLAYAQQTAGTNAPTDDIITANASTLFAAGSNYSTQAENRVMSAFTRVNYDFDQKYLVTFVLRADAVSQLAPEKRTGYFPGMSAGWNLEKEEFYQDLGISKILINC